MAKSSPSHRKTTFVTEKNLENTLQQVQWVYRADKVEFSIPWTDSSAARDWDSHRQVILDRIAAFEEAPLRFKNAGASSDSLYLRYACYENEFIRFEAHYQRDGSICPHIRVLGYLRFTVKDPINGYPLHHRFIQHAERALSIYGIPFVLRYAELALDTLNKHEWLRLIHQTVVPGAGEGDYGHCIAKGKPKRVGRHPLSQNLYIFDKNNQIQVVFYRKEDLGIYRVELRLTRKWLGRGHKNLCVGKINRFDTLFKRGIYIISHYLRLYEIEQEGTEECTSFEKVFSLSDREKCSVNAILRRKRYARRLHLPPVYMESFYSPIINVPQNVDTLTSKCHLQQLSLREQESKQEAKTTRKDRREQARHRLQQRLSALSPDETSDLPHIVAKNLQHLEHTVKHSIEHPNGEDNPTPDNKNTSDINQKPVSADSVLPLLSLKIGKYLEFDLEKLERITNLSDRSLWRHSMARLQDNNDVLPQPRSP